MKQHSRENYGRVNTNSNNENALVTTDDLSVVVVVLEKN